LKGLPIVPAFLFLYSFLLYDKRFNPHLSYLFATSLSRYHQTPALSSQ
jgi:hypothetical protein